MDEEIAACPAVVEEALSRGKHELKLSGADLDKWLTPSGTVPHRLFQLDLLNFLELSNSGLQTVPAEISKLSNLTSLMLHSNRLQSLPSSIGKLTKLKFLNVANNSISSLPESLHECLEMQSLIAFQNRLSAIPDSFASLVLLNDVKLAGNCLSEFPRAFCSVKMNRLLTLDLSGNQIKRIPDGVMNLCNLRTLDLSNNKLSSIPRKLAECSKLKDVKLNDNCLADKRLEKLIKSGTQKAILQYIAKFGEKESSDGTRLGNGESSCESKATKSDVREILPASCKPPPAEFSAFSIVVHPPSSLEIRVASVVDEIRPYLLCCVVHDVDLSDPEKLKTFIKVQSRLHQEECKKRTIGTIATHDLAAIHSPLLYTCRNPNDIVIHPLSFSKPVTATELMKRLTAEAEALKKEKKRNVYSGIHQYLYLLKDKTEYPCLIDADGHVISLPPLTNSALTKVSSSTTDVLVEVTSSATFADCNHVMNVIINNLLLSGVSSSNRRATSDKVPIATSLQIEQIKVLQESGSVRATFPSRNDLKFDNVSVNRDLLK